MGKINDAPKKSKKEKARKERKKRREDVYKRQTLPWFSLAERTVSVRFFGCVVPPGLEGLPGQMCIRDRWFT